ncbi:recombinase RecT [Sodalis sp. (in: enterobacteria)]|uniref:recombinase RecT n=1 Tax=Sodalis sp. (in: enterobacteria) TaxID=1898979 RepID=UPI003F2ABB68
MNGTSFDAMNSIHSDLQATLLQQGIESLLPPHVPVEQFTCTAATALVKDSDLQFADKQSLVLALTQCATDGLMPDGREAAMVVRNTKNSNGQYEKRVVYMPMIDGLLKRANQSGQVSSIFSDAVYSADEFKRWSDERGKHFKHTSNDTDERGELRLVYAAARLKNGDFLMEVMTRGEVDAIRNEVKTAGKESSPWQKQYREMAIKTVTKRLCKRLPGAAEIYSLLDVGHSYTNEHVAPVVTPMLAANARPRFRDVIKNHRFTSAPQATAPETAPVPAESPAPEPDVAPPALEAALIAFDDATDEESYQAVVEHCKSISQTLSEAHRGVLRAKMNQTWRGYENPVERLTRMQRLKHLWQWLRDTLSQPGHP